MATTQPENITPQQQRAIVAMLTAPSIAAAAQQAGVGERTLFRWLQDDSFLAAYRTARRDAVSQAMARLQRYSSDAVDTLYQIMTTSSYDSAKIHAAKTILEYAHKAVELEDVEVRLAALESSLKGTS